MTPPLTVLAPVAGTVVAMADVPDPVFAGEIVGPGLAIDPTRDGTVVVVAPVAGTVAKLHPHAFVIQSDTGRGALVHLGLDTVQLGGEGFTLHAREGDSVDAGDDIISWNPGDVEAGGRSGVRRGRWRRRRGHRAIGRGGGRVEPGRRGGTRRGVVVI